MKTQETQDTAKTNTAFNFDDVSVDDLLTGGQEELDETDEQSEDTENEADEENSSESTDAQNTDPVEKQETTEGTEGDDGEENLGIIQELSSTLGYEVEGEFDESIEGIANYTKAVAGKMASQQVGELFEKFPDAYHFIKHLAQGGKKEDFLNASTTPAFLDSDLTKASDDTLKTVIKQSLTAQGFDEESIEETLEDYEDTGLLKKQGTIAQRFLKKHYEKENTLKEQQRQKEIEVQEQEAQKTANTIREIITKGELGGNFKVPEAEKKAFASWMFGADKDGKTKRDLEREAMSLEEKLALEYLFYRKFKLDDIVTKKAQSINAQKLKEQLTRQKTNKLGTNRTNKSASKSTADIPDFADIFG